MLVLGEVEEEVDAVDMARVRLPAVDCCGSERVD